MRITNNYKLLTSILPLYVMIVKLRQNFTKMRKFSQIRDKKNNGKNNYCLRDTTMFPNGNIGGFQHKLLKPIQGCFLPYKTIRAINLRRFMVHFSAHGSV